ncbi:MAG: LysR family transcriptional regulator [Alphaproteobacteria bacterium]|nr:LysR family transcriptional regulator [Alphaproteobacteria bacterium]
MALDTRDLAYFAEILDSGSITAAALHYGISQPALSKRMQLLEKRLGVKLLERTRTGVTATIYGESLYVRARAITSELARAETELEELSGTGGGKLSIGVLPSQAADLLPRVVVKLAASRPDLKLTVAEQDRLLLVRGLRQGDYDLIVSVIGEYEESLGYLNYKILLHDHPTIVVRKSHPIAETSVVQTDQFLEYPWIMPPVTAERRRELQGYLESLNIKLPLQKVECQSFALLTAVVSSSDFIGLLPHNVPSPEERLGLITSLQVGWTPIDRQIGLLYLRQAPLSSAARTLIKELQVAAQRDHRH